MITNAFYNFIIPNNFNIISFRFADTYDENVHENSLKNKSSSNTKSRSFDNQDNDHSPTSVKQLIRSSSKSFLEKVLSPTRDKYNNYRDKVI